MFLYKIVEVKQATFLKSSDKDILVNENEFRSFLLNGSIIPSTPSKIPADETWKPLIQNVPQIVDIIEFYSKNQ